MRTTNSPPPTRHNPGMNTPSGSSGTPGGGGGGGGGINFRSRSMIVVLMVLLLLALVMMPVQIRPAAYNQRDPTTSSSSSGGSFNRVPIENRPDILEDEEVTTLPPALQHRAATGNYDNYLLNIYVVFHKVLDLALFEDLKLPDAHPDVNLGGGGGGGGRRDGGRSVASRRQLKTGSIMDVVLGGNNDVTFFATNSDITKDYNESHPLFQYRVVNEWETQGFEKITGSQYGSAFNEYGAMASIYYSQYTYSNWEGQNEFKTLDFRSADTGAQRRIVLNNGLEDAFIGVLQYDMALNSRVIRMIRRRIAKTRRPAEHFPGGGGNNNNNNGGGTNRFGRNPLFGGWGGGGGGDQHHQMKFANQQRAVKLSPMHQQQHESEDAAAAATPKKKKCCVFYSVQYPTAYLLKRDHELTKKLFKLYNMHFFKQYTYDDLSKFAILDAFVIPFAEFNRLVPFLEFLMRNGMRAGALRSREARATALKELEAALALFLGLLGKDQGYEYVMMPLRHEQAQ